MTNELNRWENEGGYRDEAAEVRDRIIDALAERCPTCLCDAMVTSLVSIVTAEVRRVLADRVCNPGQEARNPTR